MDNNQKEQEETIISSLVEQYIKPAIPIDGKSYGFRLDKGQFELFGVVRDGKLKIFFTPDKTNDDATWDKEYNSDDFVENLFHIQRNEKTAKKFLDNKHDDSVFLNNLQKLKEQISQEQKSRVKVGELPNY